MVPTGRKALAIFILLHQYHGPVLGQNETDMFRYSWQHPSGTARTAGMASAFGALGADPGTVALNPAGMGLYSASELSITPAIEVNSTRTEHYGSSAEGEASNFYISNLAVVLAARPEKPSHWKAFVFGLVYDRTSDLNRQRTASNTAAPTSLLAAFAAQANGAPYDSVSIFFPFDAGPAWETYAIDPADTTAVTYQPAWPGQGPTDQRNILTEEGSLRTTSLFFSGNLENRLYLGASLGILGFRYTQRTDHKETQGGTGLQEMNYRYDLGTQGDGVDLKLGMIYRVHPQVRLGLSVHSPQWFNMNDTWNADMDTRFGDGRAYALSTPTGSYTYNVRTPWRAVASAAFLAGARGAINVDYHFMDNRSARYSASSDVTDGYDYSLENKRIREAFRSTHGLRIGAELRAKRFYFRGGVAGYSDAWRAEDARAGDPLLRGAIGVGYRAPHFSIDLAHAQDRQTRTDYLYSSTYVEATRGTWNGARTFLTFSWRG
jgi:hypothetical protein